MVLNENEYTWSDWTMPVFTSNNTWGTVSASSVNTGHEPYLALDGNLNTQWENKEKEVPTTFSWVFEKPLKISQIKLTNKKSGSDYLTSTVKVYSDVEKTNLLKEDTFNKSTQSVVTITFENPVCLDMIVFELDTYNKHVGLSELSIIASVGERKQNLSYYYGKYLLPEIPVVDGYPYVCIRKNDNSGYFDVIYSKTQFFVNSDRSALDYTNSSNEVAHRNKILISSPLIYESVTPTTGFYGLDSQRSIIWTKQDILDGSSTSSVIWMKGHEPSLTPYIGVYNSVEEIFNANVSDFDCLVNNSSYDDNSYTITSVPNWIKFNNIAVTSIQVNGNSWIGFNGSTEHIKFNRRDAKMYYLWTEEGLLYNYYKFYRIRWKGYSQYNYTSSSYLQEWEVIIFDTGDICIHAINIPTSSYDGANNIIASQTYAYTKLAAENRFVTFYSQDENNTIFTVDQNCIVIEPPYDRKYLIKAENKLYTITDGALVELESKELNAELFRTLGIDTIPESALLITLIDPEIFYWIDTNEHEIDLIKAVEKATPPIQVIESIDYDMTHPTILGIEKILVDATPGVMFAVSFDSGTTWKMWTGTEWGILSERASGMSAEVMSAITTEQWNTQATTGKFRFRIAIPNVNDKFKSLVVDYIN